MTAAALLASPDWQAFLARIREAPDDDNPRLILADWLEDRGLDRAAWQLRGRCPQTAGQGLRWRVPGTWAGTPYDGLPPMPELASFTSAYVFHRGFVERVECTAAEWLASGSAVVRHPLACVTTVVLSGRQPDNLWAWWARQDDSYLNRPYRLPWWLFGWLAGGRLSAPGERTRDRFAHAPQEWEYVRIYPTTHAARDALSAAALAHAWWAADPGPPREM